MQELLSIVVPVYNVSTYLEQCVSSILNQSYKNLELILVDDGSDDGSEVMCDNFAQEDRRVIVIHKENAGVCAARKTGARRAKGYYIAFVDSDDWIEATMYETLVTEMKQNDLDVISSGYFKDNNQSSVEIFDGLSEGIYTNNSVELCENMIFKAGTRDTGISACLWNKVFVRTKLLSELMEVSDDIFYGEDAACVYTFLPKVNRIEILHEPFYHYRYRTDSVMHSSNDKILIDIGLLYVHLKEQLKAHKYYKVLKTQIDLFISLNIISGINFYIGFEEEAKIPMYLVPNRVFSYGKRIVLYGAGMVGQTYERQLRACKDIEIVKWIDKMAYNYKEPEINVYGLLEILSCEYDVILIAVRELKVAEEIREELRRMGIDNDKIFWEKPRTIIE